MVDEQPNRGPAPAVVQSSISKSPTELQMQAPGGVVNHLIATGLPALRSKTSSFGSLSGVALAERP